VVNVAAGRQLIRRELDPRNRKSRLISLTEKGRRIYSAVRQERGRIYEEWLCDLSEVERRQVDDGLRKVMRRVVLAAPGVFKD
jgi:DNA-binding MarR family transcriptional regulator